MKDNYVCYGYDVFLKSICSLNKSAPKFIEGYTDDIAEYLQSLGYIKISGDGIYKVIEVTNAGKDLLRNGGFENLEKKKNADDEIKKMQSELNRLQTENLRLQNEELKYKSKVRLLEIISVILGLIATTLVIFK